MAASELHVYPTIAQFDKTIVLPRKLATGSIHDYMFCYCPLVGILFEVLRITQHKVYRRLHYTVNKINEICVIVYVTHLS